MEFLLFLVVVAIAYMIWRIMDQLPDIVFRLSEIQRDMVEIRRSREAKHPVEAAASEMATPTSDAASDSEASES